MKKAMSIINLILSATSCTAVITNLIMADFGYAWLWLIPMVYGILNIIAIEMEYKRS